MTQPEPNRFERSTKTVPNSKWGSWLSWLVITAVTLGLLALTLSQQSEAEIHSNPPRIDSFDLSQLELQGKTLVLEKSVKTKIVVDGDKKKQNFVEPFDVPERLDERTINQRWCYSILVNDLQGPSQATDHLSLTNERLASAQLKLDEEQKRVDQLLKKSFQECEVGEFQLSNLKSEDVDLLREQLGWFADLLFAADKSRPELRSSIQEQANSVFKLSITLFAAAGLAVALGGFLVVLVVILICLGKLKYGFTHERSRHHLYLQAFAIWMLIFIGGQIVFELALGSQAAIASRLAWGMIPFLGSLVALAWPCIRGVRLQDMLADIGWKIKNPLVEITVGIASYFMLLPFILLGLLIFVGMTALTDQRTPDDFSSSNKPSHPIQEWMADDNAMTIPLIIAMACVAAPIVEETMFRGVLYRYLRDATSHRAWWLSMAVACLVNSLIFAVIHPQGLMALPLLGTLAVGFSLSREYRESLIAPMVMHGMNNGIVTLIMIFLL